jgi:hypothetical protein
MATVAVRPKVEPKIIHQTYFKSVGPRTYAAQVKECGNGNHLLVLIEGKRDPASNEVRKTQLYIFAEDFDAFFGMLRESVQFIKAHPVPEAVREKRRKFWTNQPLPEKLAQRK